MAGAPGVSIIGRGLPLEAGLQEAPMPTRLADYLACAALALFIALLALASPTPAQAATAVVQAR